MFIRLFADQRYTGIFELNKEEKFLFGISLIQYLDKREISDEQLYKEFTV